MCKNISIFDTAQSLKCFITFQVLFLHLLVRWSNFEACYTKHLFLVIIIGGPPLKCRDLNVKKVCCCCAHYVFLRFNSWGGLCVYVWCVFFTFISIYILCVCPVFTEPRKGHQIAWNWSYRHLWATTWMLEIKPSSSALATTALNYWTISPAPSFFFFLVCLVIYLIVSYVGRRYSGHAQCTHPLLAPFHSHQPQSFQ